MFLKSVQGSQILHFQEIKFRNYFTKQASEERVFWVCVFVLSLRNAYFEARKEELCFFKKLYCLIWPPWRKTEFGLNYYSTFAVLPSHQIWKSPADQSSLIFKRPGRSPPCSLSLEWGERRRSRQRQGPVKNQASIKAATWKLATIRATVNFRPKRLLENKAVCKL